MTLSASVSKLSDVMFSKVHTLSIDINTSVQSVYTYVRDGFNLPVWASSFCLYAGKTERGWELETPGGRVQMSFCADNHLGVLDHNVVLENGVSIYVPMRVIKNNEGCTVIFTLLQGSNMDERELEADKIAIMADLRRLKSMLEEGEI